MEKIIANTKKILRKLPQKTNLVAACKGRAAWELEQVVKAGVKIIGENYISQAESHYRALGGKVRWHFIGHLQTNKVKKAVRIFDMIETLDSVKLAEKIDSEAEKINKKIPVLIEINSACEKQKYGVFPQDALALAEKLKSFSYILPMGLMTMGPFSEKEEDYRPYFRKTKEVFEQIKKNFTANSNWKYLSMGMSSSYKVALEEGANIVRVGTAIFGPRFA